MDSSNRESLPVSYIRQFCFCPRIPFLSVFLEIKPPSPLWVQDGVDFHEKAAMLQKRRKLSKFNLSGKGVFKSNIYLKRSVYPIHGIADGIFIMEDGEIIPLEFKAQDNFVASRGHILQLTGYAILLEEKFQREVKQGFILCLLYTSRSPRHFSTMRAMRIFEFLRGPLLATQKASSEALR